MYYVHVHVCINVGLFNIHVGVNFRSILYISGVPLYTPWGKYVADHADCEAI